MHLRIAFICAFLHTTASAETISSLALDWNGDGIEDVARLEHSRSVNGRADLLLFEGTAAGPGLELVQVATDFARAPSHPNMDLKLLQGAAADRFFVIETGKTVGPQFWSAQTNIRYDNDIFYVDKHETHQQHATFSEEGSTTCRVDFLDKLIGGGNDIISDSMPFEADPMPLAYWTSATFFHLMQDMVHAGCAPYQETYEQFKNAGIPFTHELTLDWNNDGHPDQLVLWNTYDDYNLGIYMHDGIETQHLTWVARNLRPFNPDRITLGTAKGMPDTVQISAFGPDRVDIAVQLTWHHDEPILSGFSVWQRYGEGPRGIDCKWDFRRGQQINVYTDTWFDDVNYPDPYPLSEWADLPLSEIIGECRP